MTPHAYVNTVNIQRQIFELSKYGVEMEVGCHIRIMLTPYKELSMIGRDTCIDGRAPSILGQPRPFVGR